MSLRPSPVSSSPSAGMPAALRSLLRRSSKSMLRNTSVVMSNMGASRCTVTSPVSKPTLADPKRSQKSKNFWLDRAFSGVVYTAFFPFASAASTASSPTAVLPEPVGAESNTFSPSSSAVSASSWNPSSGNGCVAARSSPRSSPRRRALRSAETTEGAAAVGAGGCSSTARTRAAAGRATRPIEFVPPAYATARHTHAASIICAASR
mmetsp:Transcript_3183/g.7854  ORF Transcript_3183/g.7854 Transcript_3183/m.7854 type:complete len:207 (-) Transcript_3183:105-725(-)